MNKILSLFTGIGGMDIRCLGEIDVHVDSVSEDDIEATTILDDFVTTRRLPFEIVFANDIEAKAKSLYCLNQPSFDPDNFVVDSIYNLLEQNYDFPDADVVTGGFPCQDFSVAGKRRGFKSKKSHTGKIEESEMNRGTLYKCMVEIINRVKPKIFVAENVYGLKSIPDALDKIKADFESLHYHVYIFSVYCPDFGVPQMRKRVLIIGFNKEKLKKPLGDIGLTSTHIEYVSCRKYLDHLDEPDVTEDVSQTKYSKGKYLGKKCQGQTEINLDGVAPTIRAEHHGNIEYRRLSEEHGGKNLDELAGCLEERRLTIRECGLLQTFSPTFLLNSTTHRINGMQAYKYIGNAVPPLLGYHVGKHLEKWLEKYF